MYDGGYVKFSQIRYSIIGAKVLRRIFYTCWNVNVREHASGVPSQVPCERIALLIDVRGGN